MPFNNLKDICIGLGIILGVVLAAMFFPKVLGSIVILSGTGFIIFTGLNGLRKGAIAINAKTRIVVYERRRSPIEFWFYVFFLTILGCFLLWCFTHLFFNPKF